MAGTHSGRHALVTGAGRGIGAAIARRLAANGARLTLLGRQHAPLKALAAELGPGSQAVACDVADAESVAHALAETTATAGPVHVLVNNAGQAASAPFTRTSDALRQQLLAVNLTGTFLVTRAALPGMLGANGGRIVNAVCPGYTETDLLRQGLDNVMAKPDRSAEEARGEFARSNPQGRLVQPEEVADAVAWLCGACAASVHGQSISVSGGEVM